MKIYYFYLFFLAFSSVWAAPQPKATVVLANPEGMIQPAIVIEIMDDRGVSNSGQAIHVKRSSAADPAGRFLSITALKDGKETVLPLYGKVHALDGNGDNWAKIITIPLKSTDTKTTYKIKLLPDTNVPAMTYRIDGKEVVVNGPVTLKAGPIDPGDLEESPSLQRSLEIGGGGDGSLLSLRARHGGALMQDHDYGRWFARLDADLSPTDDASESLIYGRIDAEIDALWRAPFPEGAPVRGSVWAGVDASFKSDQDFDNWNAAVGLTSWWFVNSDAIEWVGDTLRLSKDELPVNPLNFKLSADYVYSFDRDKGKADPDDLQVSARLIWLTRIYSKAGLPFTDTRYHVNFLVDLGATWEPDSSDFHPETRLSLEFQPVKFEESNLAFALTWVQGEFSPTFVDEEAFLAGVKFRF